ncbi:MAG TPA: hypothetical protein VK593_05110, partial [Edaphobacter sp.]|nr:hypothetical protein [Edaphobacter sp.]
MKAKLIFPVALLSSMLFVPSAICLQPIVSVEGGRFGIEEPEEARDTPYADGTRAINEGRWTDAEEIFTKIAAQRGDRADAALYWKAYAQNKEGQQARSLETCADLSRLNAKSRWVGECDALRIEIRGR